MWQVIRHSLPDGYSNMFRIVSNQHKIWVECLNIQLADYFRLLLVYGYAPGLYVAFICCTCNKLLIFIT